MKRTTALVASLAVTAALAAGGTAMAAQTATAKAPPATTAQLKKLYRLDGQFITLVKRVRACPGATAQIRTAGKIRKGALRRADRATVRVLRAKNKRMAVAVLRLARLAGKCGVAVSPGATVVVSPGNGSVTPITIPGGGGGAGGTTVTKVTFDLPVRTVLDALPVDLTQVLAGTPLPQVLSLVPLDQLTGSLCTNLGAGCVGIDPSALTSQLTSLVAGVPLIGPIAAPLLSQITSLVNAGDLTSILSVQRVSDTVVKIVPVGPLATLRALLGSLTGAPLTPIGALQIIR